MDERKGRDICAIIAGLIFADGELHPGEAKFYERMLERFGLPRDVKLEPVPSDIALEKLKSLAPADRVETMRLLMEAAAADGVLHPAERVLIGAVGDELGVSEDELDMRLQAALQR
ncbi:MAG: TerB family tellurite resistance protein [Myxococcales bacterium]|nr:TerB family tellurite resistance protein [Myxococcales bacterium]